MRYRTDLAIECCEMAEENGIKPGKDDGIAMEKENISNDITVTCIDIVNPKGEVILGRPCGRYITIELKGILEGADNLEERAAFALASQLKKMISFHYYLKVLVVGLGNEKVTPDRLGPAALSKVRITSHLFKIYDCDGDEEQANVSGIAPGVTATTGIETAELIKGIVQMKKPDVVIAIDSLAARNIERVSTTLQLNDSGIAPGAGMGNIRTELNEETLGTKIVAIGVPTVIDSQTLIMEAMEETGQDETTIHKYIENRNFDMVVTSTDIDILIEKYSDIISKAINITLHPGIYSMER